jgi:hypothetical protein
LLDDHIVSCLNSFIIPYPDRTGVHDVTLSFPHIRAAFSTSAEPWNIESKFNRCTGSFLCRSKSIFDCFFRGFSSLTRSIAGHIISRTSD